MATNNSSNQQYVNNADGFALGGGTTARTLTVTGGNATITASGSNVYTMPAATDTLVGRTSTDTLTNKTLTSPALTTPTFTWTNNTVTAAALATNAIKLGQTDITSGSINHTNVETTIASVTVTVPAGGRDLELTCIVPQIQSTVANDRCKVNIKEGTTILQTWYEGTGASTTGWGRMFETVVPAPSAGSHTYIITSTRDVGTGTVTWYNDALGAALRWVAKII